MPIYRGLSGVNREIKEIHRGLSGTNREIIEQYRGFDGVNRKVYEVEADLILYDAGDEKPVITGGWVTGHVRNGIATKYEDRLYITSKAYGQYATWRPSNKIDFTNLNELHFDINASISGSCAINLMVHDNPNGVHGSYVLLTSITSSKARQIIIMDVSAITGEHYILFQSNSAGGVSSANLYGLRGIYN